MNYNPQIHHRRSIRLKGYDYSLAGAYFITICCGGRECRFGQIENDEMILNECGTIAFNEWMKLPERFLNFELDVFQIMPNHMHGIIVLNEPIVGATLAVAQNNTANNTVGVGFIPTQKGQPQQHQKGQPQQHQKGQPQGLPLRISGDDNRAGVNPARTIARTTNAAVGDVVGAYKSLVSNACLEIFKNKNEIMGKLWQRNYHEHIIRSAQSYQTISDYIINNPSKWKEDKFYV